jgi:hypothetical protein
MRGLWRGRIGCLRSWGKWLVGIMRYPSTILNIRNDDGCMWEKRNGDYISEG